MKYSKDDIEKAGVHYIESMFLGKEEIRTFLKSGDKDDIIDGHLFYKGKHKFNVQVKSSETNTNNQISRKYIESAQTQDLIYFYCPNVVGNDRKLYYKIFNKKEIIEEPMYLNMGKSISIGRCDFEEFEYTKFIEKLDFFVEQNAHTKFVDNMTYATHFMPKGKTRITGKIDPMSFNTMEVNSMKTVMEQNGILYNVVPENKFKCHIIPNSSDVEFEIEGAIVNCKKSVDAVGNVRFAFKNITIDFIGATDYKLDCEVKYTIKNFNAIEYKELQKGILFLEKIGKVEDNGEILNIKNMLTKAEKFVCWLENNNLYKLAQELESCEVNQLLEEYCYYSCLDEKELEFVFLRISTDKFIVCIKKDILYNLNNLYYLGYNQGKEIVLNYFVYFLRDMDYDFIEHLLKSINIQLENDLIKFLKGENLILNNKISNINDIENVAEYLTFILSFIKVYISSGNNEIYTSLLERLEKRVDDDIYFINYIQLKKHANTKIETKEYERLESILLNTVDKQVKLCCLILLNNYKQENAFNDFSAEEKDIFRKYPIFRLRNFEDNNEYKM